VVLVNLLGDGPHHTALLLMGEFADLLLRLGDPVEQVRRQLLGGRRLVEAKPAVGVGLGRELASLRGAG